MLCHKFLALPLSLPWIFTNHHVADLARFLCFVGFNVLWAWNNFNYVLNCGLLGWLTVANGALALIFGARNNLVAVILRVPSPILLMNHRWTGLAAVVHATIHFSGDKPWLTTSALSYIMQAQRNQVGLMAWCSLCIIALSSTNIVRRMLFEVFYYLHFVFIAFAIGAIIHASHGLEFILPGLILWGIDRLIRVSYNFRRVHVTEITQYEGDVTKLKVHGVGASRPGMVAWFQIKNISFANWHLFTVLPGDSDNELTVVVRGLGTYTRRVALFSRDQNDSAGRAQAMGKLKLRVDGPYGVGRLQGTIYPLTVLVAGGIGVTPGISIADHIMRQAEGAGDAMTGFHVHLVWIVKESQHLDWVAEEIKEISAQAVRPSVHATFGTTFYVTGCFVESASKSAGAETQSEQHPGPAVPGRPNMSEVFQDLQATYPGVDTMVNMCGPRSLVNTVRMAAVHASSPDGIFYVDEESFEF